MSDSPHSAPARSGSPDTETPMFFGPAGRRLFGVYHPSASPRGAVVLCAPTGDETSAALRGLRLLARRLARAGFACLRFDWFATGDSEGEDSAASWERWQTDVSIATEHLRALSGAERVTLIGARLGGALASLSAEEQGGVSALILWEPVTEGRLFVEEKRLAHLLALEEEERERPGAAAYARPDELLGTPFPTALREGMSRVNVGAIRTHVADRMLTIRNRGYVDAANIRIEVFGAEGPWYETFERRAGRQERMVIDEDAPWARDHGVDTAPVPSKSIAAILGWLEEVYA